MASVHKHRGTTWLVRFRNLSGQNKSRSCPDKATATRLARDIEQAHALGREWEPEKPRPLAPTLRTIAAAFITARARKLRPRTLERYGETLDVWIAWAEALGDGELSSLSLSGLELYWDHLLGPTGRHGHARKPTTAAKHIAVIILCWKWAFSRSRALGWEPWIPPPEQLDMPSRPRHIVVAPTWEEADRMIAHLRPGGWMHRLAWLQRCGGLRLGEALRVRWAELTDDVLLIHAEDTKGGYGGRIIPLAPVLLAEMATWPRDAESIVNPPARALTSQGVVQPNALRAWVQAGVRPEVYRGRPTHALRKAFSTGIRVLGGAGELVELYTGHALPGSGDAYIDRELLIPRFRELVKLVPPVPPVKV